MTRLLVSVMLIWNVKKDCESKVRMGHPWVFANELVKSSKTVNPGGAIELRSELGDFLARGYGNPHSFIAFRALSFREEEREFWTPEFLWNKLVHAYAYRKRLGFSESFRVCFSEGDEIPGLIIDRYVIQQNQKAYQVFVAQILTAGIENLVSGATDFFKIYVDKLFSEKLSAMRWEQTLVVIRRDGKSRQLEGLGVSAPEILSGVAESVNLENVEIAIAKSENPEAVHLMTCDLVGGQKTGFFLDQSANIQTVVNLLRRQSLKPQMKVLDLCCHLGQWGVQVGAYLKTRGCDVTVTAVDVSERCLSLTSQNLQRAGLQLEVKKLDVLSELPTLSEKFDVIITDPPAFIKNRKDMAAGQKGYLKLNAMALTLLNDQGLYVTCSCSGLLATSDFKEIIGKAQNKVKKKMRILATGGHSPDHPIKSQFSDGDYLKMLVLTGY